MLALRKTVAETCPPSVWRNTKLAKGSVSIRVQSTKFLCVLCLPRSKQATAVIWCGVFSVVMRLFNFTLQLYTFHFNFSAFPYPLFTIPKTVTLSPNAIGKVPTLYPRKFLIPVKTGTQHSLSLLKVSILSESPTPKNRSQFKPS